jgi:methyl-accepting chemotaxis protein
MGKPTPKYYLSTFVRTSMILFACGVLVTSLVLYLANRTPGTSYADSFMLLSDLERGFVKRALALFFSNVFLSVVSMFILGIFYSHRVAGALYRLSLRTRAIISGDLAEKVRLRSTDVVHVVADDINDFTGHYRDILTRLNMKVRELASIMDKPAKPPDSGGNPRLSENEYERIQEIREILDRIKP